MKCNVGDNDKLVRLVFAIVLAFVSYEGKIWWVLGLAGALLLTAALGIDPLYKALRINTCREAEMGV